jgi:hypothetical protein
MPKLQSTHTAAGFLDRTEISEGRAQRLAGTLSSGGAAKAAGALKLASTRSRAFLNAPKKRPAMAGRFSKTGTPQTRSANPLKPNDGA